MKEYFEIYLDDNKLDFCFEYNFENQKKYKIKIKCIKLLTNMSYMFSKCSSLLIMFIIWVVCSLLVLL